MKNKHLHKKEGKLEGQLTVENGHDEFPDNLPVLDYLNDSLKKSNSSRRDFLKSMGFSISAATLAASCEIPVKKALPYVDKPEEITPGKAIYYASSYFDGRSFANILVKNRDGRPIKVDGNPDSPVTRGATSASIQASVLSLYDHTRFQSPMISKEVSTWEDTLAGLKQELQGVRGEVVLLTGPIISPSLSKIIQDFQAKYGARHVVYSSAKNDALLIANEQSFGQKAAPAYRFDRADVVASFGADFLNNWLGGETFYAKDYASKRKVSAENAKMSRHYQVESYLSLTGSNADKRLAVKPSELKSVIFQLHNLIAGRVGGNSVAGVPESNVQSHLEELAEALLAARGKSIVVTGLNDIAAQRAVNSINSMLGNYGSTIDFSRTLNFIQGDNNEFNTLMNDVKAGRIGALLNHGANAVYDSPIGQELAEAMEGIGVTASFDSAPNETNQFAKYILPDHHYLESWADYEPVTGNLSVAQPVIQPIFDTKSFSESLLLLTDHVFAEGEGMYEYFQSSLQGRDTSGDFQSFWNNTVKGGFSHSESVPASTITGTSMEGISFSADEGNTIEVVLFEDKLGAGQHSANPYMQELPDPVSKVTWDNYAAISPAFAKANGWQEFNRNVKPGNEKAPVLKITANGKSIDLPLLILPGMPNGVVGIPVGYGREYAGLVGTGIGQNAHKLSPVVNGLVGDYAAGTIEKTGKKYELAQTQIHYTIPDSRTTVKETTLTEYKANPKAGNVDRYLSEFRDAFDVTLYPEREFPGHKWGMSIDLNTCTGCSACVVACNVENNIPVVGKKEVANQRDMHWLRIDRYFASEDQDPHSDHYLEDPSVVFMPMLCQHCDNAPCENVCPVNATNHSTEGLNQMSYNRCIGTRYCANNCPFKVRRFNWFDYWGADAWGKSNDIGVKKGSVYGNDVNSEMRNDFSRMILNPDVTVRSRGVIEKCSFCVQRIQEKKLDAKIRGEAMDANAIKTACQQACPTDAIVFGDTNNKESEVHKLQNDDRNFFVLEEYHVLPSVGYLTKVTNSDKALFDKMDESHFVHGGGHGDEGHGNGHGDDGHSSDSHGDNGHQEEETH